MIKTNELIVAGVGLGLGILAIYLLKKKTMKPASVLEDSYQDTVPDRPDSKTASNEIHTPQNKKHKKLWPLTRGSSGKEVERLQIWLLRNHGWKGAITREYDAQTDRLVKKVFKKDFVDRANYEKYHMGTPIHELVSA